MQEVLKCPKCGKSLFRVNKSYQCENHHNFDLNKKGYLYLLLANQKHSDNSGDSKFMMEARNRFLSSHHYDILRDALTKIIASYFHDDFIFGDMACGEGYYTSYIHDELLKLGSATTYGIDLSSEAINESSRKQRLLKQGDSSLYLIGNLSFLPFLDNSFDLLLNSFAKLEEDEFFRVLKPQGIFIRVLPGKDHLLGLKNVVYDHPYLNEAKDLEIKNFNFIKEILLEDEILLTNQEIKDVFTMTPYYYKSPRSGVEKLYSLDSLKTKISFRILIYQKN